MFRDVSEQDACYEAVLWAVQNQIAVGTAENAFSPDAACTRAQMVTFLWRAAGQPTPTRTVCEFTDVRDGDYFYNAILWAAEQKIAAGISRTVFAPDAICTRGQTAEFLYRYSNAPAVSGIPPFTDVPSDAHYYDAVTWAAQEGIAAGVSAAAFCPENNCTRGQMVMFLYRLLGG